MRFRAMSHCLILDICCLRMDSSLFQYALFDVTSMQIVETKSYFAHYETS
jgi:hypothetical protein